MLRTCWLSVLVSSMLSATVFADDSRGASLAGETPPAAVSVEALLAELAYGSRVQLFYPLDATTAADEWPEPIANIDFPDRSALARASKFRSLSLLTLAEVGHGRLFFGVNHDGLVGLHFNAFRSFSDERYLEVVRLPYLKDNGPVSKSSSVK